MVAYQLLFAVCLFANKINFDGIEKDHQGRIYRQPRKHVKSYFHINIVQVNYSSTFYYISMQHTILNGIHCKICCYFSWKRCGTP